MIKDAILANAKDWLSVRMRDFPGMSTPRLIRIAEAFVDWASGIYLELDKNVQTKQGFEDLIKDLKKNMKIRLRGANILTLSFVGTDPEMTQAFVQSITDIFIEKNMEAQVKLDN